MNLGSLKPSEGSRKKRKRVGRGEGSGHGGTSCRGHKGQNARSGSSRNPGFEGGQMPLYRRIPKRGFRNPFRKDIAIINVSQLNRFPEGTIIDESLLIQSGLVRNVGDGIKVLGKGLVDRPLSVKLEMVSRGAKEKILAAGGSVVEGA
ncbi:MAG: 50S ribosomal protein L15 [Deltaproteobacteria bacterium HGW-Deltaproteobacteria-19]|nr:MAG: 50S ribosomal protein L15 [Deltaproteobacteria bacterium HGW-Deltaproteobacteria-19]